VGGIPGYLCRQKVINVFSKLVLFPVMRLLSVGFKDIIPGVGPRFGAAIFLATSCPIQSGENLFQNGKGPVRYGIEGR
jgi:hypothetical protein